MRRFYIFMLIISFNASAQAPSYRAIVKSGAPGGYYFVAPLFYSSAHNSYNMILDSAGNLVFYQPFYGTDSYGFTLQPNGLMSYFATTTNSFILEDSAFNSIGTIDPQDHYIPDVHELRILPNGNYLLIAQEDTVENLSSYDYFNGDSTPGSSSATVICSVIQELDENKNVVFEWHAKDHFSFDSVDPFFLALTSTPSVVDWTHSNALDLDTDGNILLSSRHFNEITKINIHDGSIMWRLGGKYNQFTFIGGDTVPFYGQHDIRSLPNGHYTLYDDGNHNIPHGARGVEYQLNAAGDTAQAVWAYTYSSTMYSDALGNVQRLQESNTLIDYGIILSNNVCFNVVDSIGTELFRLTFTTGAWPSYRAFNYPTLPWGFNRPQISCFESNDTLYLDAGSGYKSYEWSNGKTTETIAVTAPDSFSVFVPYGQSGFINSEKMNITDIHNPPCEAASVSEVMPESHIKVFPNPAHDMLNIYGKSSMSNVCPVIKDISERIVSIPETGKDLNNNTFTYDISSLADGFYILSINGQSFKFIKD